MIAELFHTFIYAPIYNALAFLVGIIPGGDVGIAIILITILIRLILFPLSLKASRTQAVMRAIDPELKSIRAEHKDNKEELARRTMALFKEHKVNPFASFLFILIQLPVIFGLYFVFLNEGNGISFDPSLLYSFVATPVEVSSIFLGFIDLTGRSILLAVIVAVTQFFYARLTMPVRPTPSGKKFQDDLSKSMHLQMRYVFPLVLGGIAYATTSAIALYFVISNLFGIGQELLARHLHRKDYGHT